MKTQSEWGKTNERIEPGVAVRQVRRVILPAAVGAVEVTDI